MPKIKEQYIDTGKVYHIFRDLPLTSIHPGAMQAAEAARCADDQGQFWPMHDRLFEGQAKREWGSGGERDLTTFLAYANELKLDATLLESCLKEQRYQADVEADMQEALRKRINSTPSFTVNGQLVQGALPFERWQGLFDSLLTQQ